MFYVVLCPWHMLPVTVGHNIGVFFKKAIIVLTGGGEREAIYLWVCTFIRGFFTLPKVKETFV